MKMNNQLKKLFILPSLLLANAYLFVGAGEIKSNIVLDNYSEKIKLSSVEEVVSEVISEPQNVVSESKISEHSGIFFLNILSLSLAFLLFSNDSLSQLKTVHFQFTNLVLVKLKTQKRIFNFIQSKQKAFHSVYQKFFFYSFIA